jgi:site-specific recombinase XerD
MSTLAVTSIPSIAIFVRHSAECEYRGDENHKGCRCPKHFRYTHDGKQTRQSARTRFWKTAEDRRRLLEASFAADATSAVAIAPEARKTIARAVELFIKDKRTTGLSANVVKKYERELGRFESFMAKRSKFLPHDISAEDLTEFRADWAEQYPSSTTRGKVQERLKAFLKHCYDARLIDRVPQLSPIKINSTPTLPLTAAQYAKLLEVIPQQFSGDKATRVRALVQFMRHTGLSVMDAVTIERSEIHKHGSLYSVITSRQKTGTHVSVPIPPAVAKAVLAAMKLNQHPQYIFWNTGAGKPQSAVTHWQHDLRQAFRAAGMPNGHPHQLRDTFAVALLSAGVPVEEVSKLLGHTSIKTTEKHYAPWVKARQARLDALVISTWKERAPKHGRPVRSQK